MTVAVTVIIPTYNRAHLVTDAIESVFAQTFKDYEIIIVDDGSTDRTAELIGGKYAGRLKLIAQTNQGISSARNRGIQEAKGKYIAFLDSDDKWLPEKLAKQVAYMEANPQLGFSCTKFRAYEINLTKSRAPQTAPNYRYGPTGFSNKFADLLISKNFIPTSTVMVRRDCFAAVGIYDESIPCYEDFDLWLRLAKRYPYDLLDELLVEYREHSQNTSKNDSKVHEGLWVLYSKILDLYRDDIPNIKLFKKRIAAYQYLVGTERIRKGNVKGGFKNILGSFRYSLSFGNYFMKDQSPVVERLFYLAKPYIVLISSFFMFLFYLPLSFLKKEKPGNVSKPIARVPHENCNRCA